MKPVKETEDMKPYIEPFVEACKYVFKNLLKSEIIAETPYFLDRTKRRKWDISGVIGLTGDARGGVAISMKEELACKLTGKLTGKVHTALDDEVTDAIGEIVNIISGNAKQRFEKIDLVISLPTIVRGQEHTIIWPKDQINILAVPFQIFENEQFILSASLEIKR
jgi:chemotaxis protein CheX